MKSVKEKQIYETIINKSKFISIIIPLNDVSLVSNEISNIKKEYKDATHYCYSYIINGLEKCSDDGEPSGTAGKPILNVLKQNDLTNVLCVVVRYFGGIKLGSGGLIRAYSNSVRNVLSECEIDDIVNGFYMEISFDYESIKKIDYLLKGIKIDKIFANEIIYKFNISSENLNKIENELNILSKINVKKDCLL